MPCPPGVRPVPSEVMLTAVVAGKQEVSRRECGEVASSVSAGASWGCAASSSAPSPSTSSTPTAAVEGITSARVPWP